MQGWFLGWDAFISIWNVFYGLLHFSVTFFTLIWLYLKFPEVYQRWRTTGLVCTGLGLVGFALFPLMPPRLLGDCGPYGACLPDAGFVDTMIHYEGLWSFDSGTFQALSNQYAAMPSIHFAWAFWCFLALRGRVRSGWGRVCLYLYPPLTLFAVVVTANHYWIDAVAGVACLLLALAWATPLWCAGANSAGSDGWSAARAPTRSSPQRPNAVRLTKVSTYCPRLTIPARLHNAAEPGHHTGIPAGDGLRRTRRARRGDPGFHRGCGHHPRWPSRLEPRRGGVDTRPAPRLQLSHRCDHLGHGPPGLRAQDRHRPLAHVRGTAQAGRAVGLPVARGIRARLGREQPRLDVVELRPRAGDGLPDRRGAGRAPAPRGGGDRGRVDDRRHGLRGG